MNTRTKQQINSRLDRLLDFLFSFISEENCRICQRVLIAHGQLLEALHNMEAEARPAIIHRWVDDIPRYSRALCSTCWEGLTYDTPIIGFYENAGLKSFPIISGAPYASELRGLIHTFKYEGDTLLAPDLAALMLNGWRMGSIFIDKKSAVLVPVPLHWRKGMERGFNQSELLAHEASKVLDIPVLKRALTRKRMTTPQQSLEKSERFTNMENAFRGDERKLSGKSVVIVDDICTSGATLAACVEETLRCGATEVVALTVARTILRLGKRTGNSQSSESR